MKRYLLAGNLPILIARAFFMRQRCAPDDSENLARKMRRAFPRTAEETFGRAVWLGRETGHNALLG